MVAWCIGMDITAIAFHAFSFDHWLDGLGAIWCFNVLWMMMMMMEIVMSIIDHTYTQATWAEKKFPNFPPRAAALQKLDFVMPVYRFSNKKWSQTNKNNKIKIAIMKN